jgi:hypothetical protein
MCLILIASGDSILVCHECQYFRKIRDGESLNERLMSPDHGLKISER